MIRSAFLARLLALTLALPLSALLAKEAPLRLSLDRPEAIYTTGETATFLLESSAPGGTEITWSASLDGHRKIQEGTEVARGTAPSRVSLSLDQPGFLLLTATVKGADGKVFTTHASAAFSPEQIPPSLPVPDDFDAFWDSQKKTLAAVPLEPVLTPVPLSAPDEESLVAYDISVPTGETAVTGYFALPKNATPKSLPAVLWVHGAGVRSSSLPAALNGARDGFLSLDINAHGLPNGKPADFYKEIAAGELKTYRSDGNTSREAVYFRGMFVRLMRALDFLTNRPEWNGKILAVSGHSQGGYQALAAGGLDPRVTFVAAGVPAGCDHTGMKANRISGWPKIVSRTETGAVDEKTLEASRYVDAVNFAARCRAEGIFTVGFIDLTCPPTSVYAAYNRFAGPKRMLARPAMGHAQTEEIRAEFRAALLQHAGK